MAVNSAKKYADMIEAGMSWHGSKPQQPLTGDCYIDTSTSQGYIYDGTSWKLFSSGHEPPPKAYAPTEEQLEKHPALKEAWEEFLVIRKLLGI